MLNAVIFDMDGVVVDSHPAHKNAWRRILLSAGKQVSEADLEIIFDGRKREDILRYFFGELTEDQKHKYGELKEAFFQEEVDSIRPIKGLPEFLDELEAAGIKLAVASCGSRRRVHYVLRHLKLTSRFRSVVTGDEVRHGKPDPAIFRKAARQLGVSSSEALVIEDAVSGVQAARSAGMQCVAIGNGRRAAALRDAGAVVIVPDFTHLSVSQLAKFFPNGSKSTASAISFGRAHASTGLPLP